MLSLALLLLSRFTKACNETSSVSQATQSSVNNTATIDNNVYLEGDTNATRTISTTGVAASGSLSILTTIAATTTKAQNPVKHIVGNWTTPHYVVYCDNWLSPPPDAKNIAPYNRFVIAFWMTSGPSDNLEGWVALSPDQRTNIRKSYNQAGIALMVSAFGSMDKPTTWGHDPIDTAKALAKFVKTYEFDGVDIDYEDFDAFNGNKAEEWIITFQHELRAQLGQSYLISHAPIAPWFTSSNDYLSGGYRAIHNKAGSGIDFYNLQCSNQGNLYTDCQTLIYDSGENYPNTSILELHDSAGIPYDSIVLGKVLTDSAADSGGYMDPGDLKLCVDKARAKGWTGGIMIWEWDPADPTAATDFLQTVIG